MSRTTKPMEAVVLLVDVSELVGQLDSDGKSFLYKSKQCASRIIQRKIFSDAADQFSVILMGSTNSDNELEYPNIEVKQKWLTSPNWNMLRDVNNLKATDVNSTDWLHGLIVAINLLKNESEGKKFTSLKIVMISNFATPLQSKDQIDFVIDTLRNLQIKLVVIGPQSDDDDQNSDDQLLKSNIQRKGEAIIGRIVDEVEGVMCGFDEAMLQLDHFQKFIGRAQPWHCDLQIGENIFIPITGYKKFAPKTLLSWKKKSIEKTAITQEIVFFKGDEQVEKQDVINSHLFGQNVVPVSGDDKTSMALTTEKCCELIGFTKKQNVPRHMALGDSAHYIVPRNDVKAARLAVTALVKALMELEMVAIVRKVYCRNATPRLGALIPSCENESYIFYFVPLPFAEDERQVRLPSLSQVRPSQAQLDAVDRLIDDMDLSLLDEDEDSYSKLVNPAVEHLNNMVVLKALNPESKLPSEPSVAIKDMLQPKSEILENAFDSLDNIKSMFKLEEIEQKTYRRRATDVFERNATNILDSSDIKPQIKGDSIADFVQSTITDIGTVDPEGSFLQLLKDGQPFDKICEQMQNVIKKLFLTSSNTIGFRKPLSALSLLREHCIKKNPLKYNGFISSYKDDLVERDHWEIWDVIAEDKLGLITSKEAADSNVSPEEADTFYQIKKCESQSEQNFEMEAEDLLDMI